MRYVYEARIKRYGKRDWFVSFPSFPGVWGSGPTARRACISATIALKLGIASYLDDGIALPKQLKGKPSGIVLCVKVTKRFRKRTGCLTVKEAAKHYEVKPKRIRRLIDAGALDIEVIGGKLLVTIESLNRCLLPQPKRKRRG